MNSLRDYADKDRLELIQYAVSPSIWRPVRWIVAFWVGCIVLGWALS